MPKTRLPWLWLTVGIFALLPLAVLADPVKQGQPMTAIRQEPLTVILGRPADTSITVSLLSGEAGPAWIEYRKTAETVMRRTAEQPLPAGAPVEFLLEGLTPDTPYLYQVKLRNAAEGAAHLQGEFHTRRRPGSTFTFALQGDSHPERAGKMFDPALYLRTLRNVSRDRPDFYLMLGDDFSIERLIERREASQANIDKVYLDQRNFLQALAPSTPLFLVNGNHEQAARYLLDGTPDNLAVMAARARARYYPLPAPDAFYSGDAEQVAGVGLLRDYYAWAWGDALFVVIDPYWHSPVPVDNRAGEKPRDKGQDGAKNPRETGGKTERGAKNPGGKARDLWAVTLGDQQYRWLKDTLEQSRAKYKFVFAHHVMGTGRGGIEMADRYEWGDAAGVRARRPGWELPIHQLMVKTGVTIFFQGHDHLYARQELDGVIYQSVPNPADPTCQAFNREAYRSGVILPNSGHLRVTVDPERVTVDYIRSYPGEDAGDGNELNAVAYSYALVPRR